MRGEIWRQFVLIGFSRRYGRGVGARYIFGLTSVLVPAVQLLLPTFANMKRSVLLAFAAGLLTLSTAQAQTKIKTKTKAADGTEVKTKTDVEPIVLNGPIKRVETLSGIDIFPASGGQSILLSFTQQFTKPGTLTVTNYKKQAIYTTALDPQNNTGAPVDLGRIPAGTYLVEAKTGNYVYWKKVMVRYPAAPTSSKKRR